jgi:hypothetical protein
MSKSAADVAQPDFETIHWETMLFGAHVSAPFGHVIIDLKVLPSKRVVGVSLSIQGDRVEFDPEHLSDIDVYGHPSLLVEDAALDESGTPRYITLLFEYGRPEPIRMTDVPGCAEPCVVMHRRSVAFDVDVSRSVRRRFVE